ncbi:MAG: 4-hydroxy-tetrahydrodipicolinate reductase [Betaproteobacteria bacterium]|nr:4-hydroxy-tetrahydrodipicolinate reductase [Betaproteobacteria bacterium]
MKLAIAGATGRMGRALIEESLKDPALALVAALDVIASPPIAGFNVVTDIAAAISAADVMIDFTRPAGTLAHLDACLSAGKAMVIGTTGFAEAQKQCIVLAAKRIPIVMAPNFAVGVNVIFKLAEIAARSLGEDYDVEIIEAHHRHKVDAPSGTAFKLGEVVAAALGRDLAKVAVHGRVGDTGEREGKAIGFHAIRGGDIVGEHTVLFAGTGERVELAVRSSSRATYALGALRAAKFLKGRRDGLFDMQDVLGLR